MLVRGTVYKLTSVAGVVLIEKVRCEQRTEGSDRSSQWTPGEKHHRQRQELEPKVCVLRHPDGGEQWAMGKTGEHVREVMGNQIMKCCGGNPKVFGDYSVKWKPFARFE